MANTLGVQSTQQIQDVCGFPFRIPDPGFGSIPSVSVLGPLGSRFSLVWFIGDCTRSKRFPVGCSGVLFIWVPVDLFKTDVVH